MASCSIETVADARRDLISELPADLKERILQKLPTLDAARTALLSTHWKDAWLRLEQLVFDSEFFCGIQTCKGESVLPLDKIIITYILLQRIPPVKKFSLLISPLRLFLPKLEQSDLDQWFLFLSTNGIEELDISLLNHQYKLPFCIFSCRTIKQLRLCSLGFDCPTNAPSIFPCVTSLDFWNVVFNDNVNGTVYSIPNLEKLDLMYCRGFSNFKIDAPKLESLYVIGGYISAIEFRWLALHLEAIKVLCLEHVLCLDHGRLLLWQDVGVASFPTTLNLQVFKLHSLKFSDEKQLKGVLQLLKKSPNLCELYISAVGRARNAAASRLLMDPDSCIINENMKMLKTIKIKYFSGSRTEMLFVKMLLIKSPTLERVVIPEPFGVEDASKVFEIQRELLCFPRTSQKAQIFCTGKDNA